MKKTRLRRRSSKKQREDRECAKLKRALFDAYPYCGGCRWRFVNIYQADYSHIAGKQAYAHLITHPKNGVLDCRECHQKWGSNDEKMMKTLINYNYRMLVLAEICPESKILRDHQSVSLPSLASASEDEHLPFL